jgi:hypothetical protein
MATSHDGVAGARKFTFIPNADILEISVNPTCNGDPLTVDIGAFNLSSFFRLTRSGPIAFYINSEL